MSKKQVANYADFTGTNEANVEDMFERNFYVDLVNAEFARQLPAAINPAALNAKEPRILRAIESWLEANPL